MQIDTNVEVIGTLLRSPARLQVLRGNPAHGLYQRLGFQEIGTDPMYIQMVWTPATA